MGILPMLSSYPQALVWGADPITLVSGGTVIWLLVVGSTFWLAAKAYGLEVAGWAILPLVFSSLGTIWLSGRITGGHLLTLVWHTAAFAGLYLCLTRGGWPRAAALGALVRPGALSRRHVPVHARRAWCRPHFSRGSRPGDREPGSVWRPCSWSRMLVGLLPREIGRRVDPYDAYPVSVRGDARTQAIWEHARLLAFHCLPRLIAGTELDAMEKAGATIRRGDRRSADVPDSIGLPGKYEWLAMLLVAAFLTASSGWRVIGLGDGPARKAVSRGTFASALLIVAAFLVNRNIYNSDNYRYLIFLLTPWALGFGLVLIDLARRGWVGLAVGVARRRFCLQVMTSATFLWYRDERALCRSRGECPCDYRFRTGRS